MVMCSHVHRYGMGYEPVSWVVIPMSSVACLEWSRGDYGIRTYIQLATRFMFSHHMKSALQKRLGIRLKTVEENS